MTAVSTCSTPTSSTRAAPCAGTSAAACSPMRTLAANLAAPSRSKTGFGTVALDVDNDGTLDLFVANGHTDDQPWFNTPMAQTAQLFLGRDRGRFELASPEVRPISRVRWSAGASPRATWTTMAESTWSLSIAMLRRPCSATVRSGGHWLGLRLRGTRSGRSPVGARVVCQAGGRSPGALADQRDRLLVLERPEALVRAGVRPGRSSTWKCAGPPGRFRPGPMSRPIASSTSGKGTTSPGSEARSHPEGEIMGYDWTWNVRPLCNDRWRPRSTAPIATPTDTKR